MAKGHQAVIRRSLNLPEWIRIRLAEVEHWGVRAAADIGGWEIRPAVYHDPAHYEFHEPWRPIKPGELWGSPDGTFFFRAAVRVPREFDGLAVWFELPTPTEMILRLDGRIVNAIDPNRSEAPLLKRARAGQVLNVELEAYVRSAPDDNRTGQRLGDGHGCTHYWRAPRLVSHDENWRQFMYDFSVAQDVAGASLVDGDVCGHLYHHLHEAAKLLDRDTTDRGTFIASVRRARAYLRRQVYQARGLQGPGALALVGHSHLDVAYHWRVRQGIRKNARTTAVQLALMDEYPEMLYCHTQPYLYETLKRYYGELYARVKRKVRQGRWELVGGLYVEPDCNVPSGESLVRQCLLGKRFFLDEFGVDVDTCWLPDVFGNSWIMPQILARSGIRYFVSNKMSTWNDTNRFPHTNFVWRGLDGSEVAACVPASHFISWLEADQLLANWEGFREKATVGESMNMFGFGDGGGGLTREMLETARRIRQFPGLPRTRLVRGKDYLDQSFRPAVMRSLARWDDELYLEMHRGTPTTKALLKKLNRRCELRAREAEIFSTLARRFGGRNVAATLTDAWKLVLVNQFHDILPGSHTGPVADEATNTYRRALMTFWGVLSDSLETIAAHARTDARDGQPMAVFNSLNWMHRGMAELPVEGGGEHHVVNHLGQAVPSQLVRNEGGRALLVSVEVPSVGFATYYVRPGKAPGGGAAPARRDALKVTARTLENRFFRIRFNSRAEIVSMLDKRTGRQVIARGSRGNVLELFEDKPGVYEAWDIVANYKDKSWDVGPAEIEVLDRGPVRSGLRVRRRFFASELRQDIFVYADLPRVDFVTRVDWHERNRLLKVGFAVDVLARRATYDLSYGCIQRPTHATTSWDRAKFEVCGHQWTDLSEHGLGVSLLNDCKYGHDIQGNVMRLSLLRGPVRPDPRSDRGVHEFTYSLWPHAGSWRAGRTYQAAHELNSPLTVVPCERHGGTLGPEHSFISLDDGAFLGALKPAHDGKGLVARVVEQLGGRRRVRLAMDRPLKRVSECDLIERPERRMPAAVGGPAIDLRPFQIRTFLVEDKP